jgi:hypothetical protein
MSLGQDDHQYHGCKRDHPRPDFLSPSPFLAIFCFNQRKKGMETHAKAITLTTLISSDLTNRRYLKIIISKNM